MSSFKSARPLAYRGIPLQSAYCGAKHAIRGFTNSLRSELIHDRSRIKLTMVELPAVNTPQFDWARTHLPRQPRPVPPVVQPEAIADAIYRAAHHPKREAVAAKTATAKPGNVVNFMDALKRSLEMGGKKGKAKSPSIVPTMPKKKKARA